MAAEHPRILFLTKYSQDGASSRYRSYQYIPYLKETGFECTVAPLFDKSYLEHKYRTGTARRRDVLSAFIRRFWTLLGAGRFDLVVIEKEIFPYLPAAAERWLNWRNIAYIADYDDALFHQYDHHPNSLIRHLLGHKIARVMERAQLVTVGNAYLADYALRAGAIQVEILPTVIDINRYPKSASYREKEKFTIGWIGSPSTAKYVEQIAPVLEEVCVGGQVRVRLIGSGEVVLAGVPFEVIPWSEDDEVMQLQQLDVGIMPLEYSPWERGKCGFKLIQYMACGLPVVASPVGVNWQIVEDGINGYLASDHKEWVSALVRLRDDPALRERLGVKGRQKVETNYSLQATAPRLLQLLDELASR